MSNSSALRLVSTTSSRRPTTLLTPAQSRSRQNFAAIAAAWKTLSITQQTGWLEFDKLRVAATSPRKLSAFNAFTSINGTRLASGMTLNTTPPTSTDLPPGLPADLSIDASYDGPGSTFALYLRSATYADHVQVFAAAPTLPGMDSRTTAGRYVLIVTAASLLDTGTDITAAYTAKYGTAEAGSQIALQLVPLAPSGLRGTPLLLTGVVALSTAAAPAKPHLTKTA